MIKLDWRQSFFQRLKVFGTLERPGRKEGPFGGSRNTKLNEAALWKYCYLFNKSLSFIFENVVFLTLFQYSLHVGIWSEIPVKENKTSKNKQTMNRNRRLTFKYSLFKWYARSTDISNRSVLVQLSSWLIIWLFSWFFLFLAVHWEQPPHLSNKTPQSQKIYAR